VSDQPPLGTEGHDQPGEPRAYGQRNDDVPAGQSISIHEARTVWTSGLGIGLPSQSAVHRLVTVVLAGLRPPR